jgi:hypothetical protein
VGGPEPSRAEYFTVVGQADLGDEGRIPPHLTGVGAKLRAGWLREVLVHKGAARPYMATRMPQFGEANVGTLEEALVKTDSSGPAEAESGPQSPDVGYGRKLVGTEGLSCISCHVFAGHKSLGIPAMDLALVTRRLRKEWFQRYLMDPPLLRPGTRMPSFWPEGKSSRPDLLKGDTARQINAIWTYLSLGLEGGLPPGLVQGKMELVATNQAIIYRHFLQGAGSRGIGVAYPEKANLAFDANEIRLALIWQGPFLDVARHRTGRGEGFEGPLGYNVVKMPPGPPFAILESGATPWPQTAGKKGGYRLLGYQLDGNGRPTFRYTFQNLGVEDYLIAVSGELEASLQRTLTFNLSSNQALENLWFRAWTGAKIEPQTDGAFIAEGKIKLRFKWASDSKPIVRQSNGKSELLVPVVLNGSTAKIVEEIVW